MIKQSALARAWGVSRAYVNELVLKRGMPIGTFKTMEEAAEWRRLNVMKRKSAMSKSSKPEPKKTPAKPAKEPPAEGRKTRQDGSLEAALNATVRVAEEAETLVMDAMKSKDIPSIAPLLSIHNKAVEARFSAERTYREEMEQQGMLIQRTAGTEMWRQGFSVIINKMKRIPQNKAQLCNPQAPLVAFGVLEDAMNEILEAAQQVYKKFNVEPAG